MTVVKLGISPVEQLLNFLTNETCLLCHDNNAALCEACFLDYFSELDSRCYICNKITSQHRICPNCKSQSRLRRVWWLGNYQPPLKDLITGMKYHRKRATARLFGIYLSEALPYIPEDTLVTAIPTATSRIRQRGFDQADLIAKSFAYHRHLTYLPLLQRSGQAELIGKKRTDRHKLMRQHLYTKPGTQLTNKTVLVIDDVLTSGASLETAGAVLRSAGAIHVDAAVIARRLLS